MITMTGSGGKIRLHDTVFARIVMETADRFGDRIMLTNAKGKRIRSGKAGREKLDFIEILASEQESSIDIRLCLLIRFGTSISGVTRDLADNIRSEVLRMTGVPVGRIRIVVTGVRSRRTARRDLHFEY